MPAPDRLPSPGQLLPRSAPARRRFRAGIPPGRWLALLAGLAGGLTTTRADTFTTATKRGTATMTLPEGTLEMHEVELRAPDVAVDAYIDAFTDRQWVIRTAGRSEFVALLLALELSPAVSDELLDQRYWHPSPDGFGFVLTPPLTLLQRLTGAERGALYHLLAGWADNKPERWPLVVASEAGWQQLLAAGCAPALVQRARALSFPFAGGWALADFSVLAAEFPARAGLQTFLSEVSVVTSSIPRLNLRTAVSLSETLSYWTVDRQNPFALPLLEAMMESDTSRGVELLAIMPGATRVLSFNIEPEDVRHDLAAASYLISTSLAAAPRPLASQESFLQWFDQAFAPTPPPLRYGDVMVLHHTAAQAVPYACAFVAADIVFARDPVGLGLWRFMQLDAVRQRNPNFSGASFQPHRLRPAAPASGAATPVRP